MSDDVQPTGTKKPKPFTDSRADVAEMKEISKRLRKNLAMDTDEVYGRLLATPQWYYSTHNGGGFREALSALSGESTTGGRPLYVAVLHSMAKKLLSNQKTFKRGLVLLVSLAKTAGHFQTNLVSLYTALSKRFGFKVIVTPGAAELVSRERVPNNTFSLMVTDNDEIRVRLTAQSGGAETTVQRIAAIEKVITELERRQRDMAYVRPANRHSRQQAVNTTGAWQGPVGKRLREGVHGEANSLKRQRIGAPASMDDLDAERAKAQDLSQQVSQNETRLVLARGRLAQLQEELAGEGQDGGAVDSASNEYTQAQIDNMERGEFDRRKTLHREYGYSPLPNGSDRRELDLALGTHTGDGGPVFVGDAHMGDVRFQMGALRSHWTMAQQIAQNNDRYHDRYHNFHRRQRTRLIELGENRVARMQAMRDAGQTTERRAQILQIAGVGAQDTGEYVASKRQKGGAIPELTAAIGLISTAADATVLALPELDANLTAFFGRRRAEPLPGDEWKSGGVNIDPTHVFATIPEADPPTTDELQKRIDARLAYKGPELEVVSLPMERFKKTLQAKVASEEQGPPEQGPLTERVQQLADIYTRQATDADPAIIDSERALMDSATGPEDLLADNRAMRQYEVEYARYTAEQNTTTRSPAAQEVIRIVSNATLPDLQDMIPTSPDDWARQLRSYNSLRGWSTIPALLLLSNRLGERYNRKRRLDPGTPLLTDVKNPLLYAWYRMTDGPDNVQDAYRGEAAVMHTLYPYGLVMLTSCFVKMSLIEDGGLLTTIANRAGAVLVADGHDSLVNAAKTVDATVTAGSYAAGYGNTTAAQVAVAMARTPVGIAALAKLAGTVFGHQPLIAAVAYSQMYPQGTQARVETAEVFSDKAGDWASSLMAETQAPPSQFAIGPGSSQFAIGPGSSEQRRGGSSSFDVDPSTATRADVEMTLSAIARGAESVLGVAGAVISVAGEYARRNAGMAWNDRPSDWQQMVEARATPEELNCLYNIKPMQESIREMGLNGTGVEILPAQVTVMVACHQDGATWSDSCKAATKCLETNAVLKKALDTGKVDLPLYRAVKSTLANAIVDAVDALGAKYLEAILLTIFDD